MVSRKRKRFVLGSNKYRHKPISLKLIAKVKRLQKEVEKKNGLIINLAVNPIHTQI